MTNEELAVMIQNGHTELHTDLWEQVYRLVCRKAERYSHLLQENGWRTDPEDFTADLIQSGYFALIDAVKYFDSKKGIKFNTYLGNTLKKAFREAAGIRSSKRDALEFSVSLDAPVLDDGDTALLDFVDSRPYDGDDMVRVEDSVYLWELRAALKELMEIHTTQSRINGSSECKRRHNTFVLTYIAERKISTKEIARMQGITLRAVYKDLNHVLDDLMVLAFGVDGVKPKNKTEIWQN